MISGQKQQSQALTNEGSCGNVREANADKVFQELTAVNPVLWLLLITGYLLQDCEKVHVNRSVLFSWKRGTTNDWVAYRPKFFQSRAAWGWFSILYQIAYETRLLFKRVIAVFTFQCNELHKLVSHWITTNQMRNNSRVIQKKISVFHKTSKLNNEEIANDTANFPLWPRITSQNQEWSRRDTQILLVLHDNAGPY